MTAMTAVVVAPAVVAVLLVATAVLATTILPLGSRAASGARACRAAGPRSLVRALPLGLPLLILRSLILALGLPVLGLAVFRAITTLAVIGTLTVPLNERGLVLPLPLLLLHPRSVIGAGALTLGLTVVVRLAIATLAAIRTLAVPLNARGVVLALPVGTDLAAPVVAGRVAQPVVATVVAPTDGSLLRPSMRPSLRP